MTPTSQQPPPKRASLATERERIVRTLTFWFRPAFLLRVVSRFQRMAGFDRSLSLASNAFTALIPLLILLGGVLSSNDEHKAADQFIHRYHLTGAGAEAVRAVFSPAQGESTSVSVVGIILFLIAALSFSRAVQRMLEQSWELKPLGVKNSINGAIWAATLVGYLFVSTMIHRLVRTLGIDIAAVFLVMPLSALMLLWTGRVLSARRISLRQLLPFAIVGALVIAGAVTAGAVYLPHMFSSYANRYGVAGAVLAMVSALFALMLVIVASAAVGREVSDELDRIGRGERPPDDEVRQEWDAVIVQAHERAQVARIRAAELKHRFKRHRDHSDNP